MANRETHTVPSKKDGAAKKAPQKPEESQKQRLVDETVWESFPASDPSSSYAGKDIDPFEKKN